MPKVKLSPAPPAERNSLCRWRGRGASHSPCDSLGRPLLVPLCVGCVLRSASVHHMARENSLPATSLILCWISKTDNTNHFPLRTCPELGFSAFSQFKQ